MIVFDFSNSLEKELLRISLALAVIPIGEVSCANSHLQYKASLTSIHPSLTSSEKAGYADILGTI